MAREIELARRGRITYFTPRDFASVLFLHRRLVLWTFLLVLGAVLIFALLRQPLYQSQMTILVNMERTDPVVTSDPNLVQKTLPGITDEEVNSEVELLKANDLMRQVVIACHLDQVKNHSVVHMIGKWLEKPAGVNEAPENVRIAKAVLKLQRELVVERIPQSTLIAVSYSSPDPQLSAHVLDTLSDLYLKKHLAVRRPTGTLKFFKQEANLYKKRLMHAEQSMDSFTRDNHVPSVEAERDATIKKLTELQVSRRETQAGIEVTKQRLGVLQNQMAQLPPRLTTQMRKTSGLPPDDLQSTLLTLELKRSELLGIYQPDYPAVKQVEEQIAAAKAAVKASQKWSAVEETTDRDATYEWLRSQAEKAKVDLVDLHSQEKASAAMIAQFSAKARHLNNLMVQQNNLSRSVKLAEDAYITYKKKQEEARISDALDRHRFLNVHIADAPYVPVLPSTIPAPVILFTGLVLACISSVGLAFGAEQMNPSFRTRDEVENLLQVPVVIAIPKWVE